MSRILTANRPCDWVPERSRHSTELADGNPAAPDEPCGRAPRRRRVRRPAPGPPARSSPRPVRLEHPRIHYNCAPLRMFDCGLVKTNGTVSMAALSLKLSRSVKTIVTETVDDGQQNPQSAAFHRLRRWFLWSSLVFFFLRRRCLSWRVAGEETTNTRGKLNRVSKRTFRGQNKKKIRSISRKNEPKSIP